MQQNKENHIRTRHCRYPILLYIITKL